jgi:hypothetical protein
MIITTNQLDKVSHRDIRVPSPQATFHVEQTGNVPGNQDVRSGIFHPIEFGPHYRSRDVRHLHREQSTKTAAFFSSFERDHRGAGNRPHQFVDLVTQPERSQTMTGSMYGYVAAIAHRVETGQFPVIDQV